MMTKPSTMMMQMIVDDDDGLTATSMNTKSTYVDIITVIRWEFCAVGENYLIRALNVCLN